MVTRRSAGARMEARSLCARRRRTRRSPQRSSGVLFRSGARSLRLERWRACAAAAVAQGTTGRGHDGRWRIDARAAAGGDPRRRAGRRCAGRLLHAPARRVRRGRGAGRRPQPPAGRGAVPVARQAPDRGADGRRGAARPRGRGRRRTLAIGAARRPHRAGDPRRAPRCGRDRPDAVRTRRPTRCAQGEQHRLVRERRDHGADGGAGPVTAADRRRPGADARWPPRLRRDGVRAPRRTGAGRR